MSFATTGSVEDDVISVVTSLDDVEVVITVARTGVDELLGIANDCNVFLASMIRPSGKANARNSEVFIPIVALDVDDARFVIVIVLIDGSTAAMFPTSELWSRLDSS